jgi:hypothetical protein
VVSDLDHEAIVSALRTRIGLLADGEFDIVEGMLRRSLSATALRDAVGALPGRLVDPPSEVWADLSITAAASGYDVEVPLWTTAGPSTLGLRMHVDGTGHRGFWVDEATFAEVEPRWFAGDVAEDRPGSAPSPRPPRSLSDTPVPERWRPALGELVRRLVLGDYAGLEAEGLVAEGSGAGMEDGIGHWIELYPDSLVDMPPEGWDYTEHEPWAGRTDSWWVIVPLWSEHERPSDLSMEATVWDDGTEVRVQIDTAPHVM